MGRSGGRNAQIHQVAFLKWPELVAWKRYSIARGSGLRGSFGPVAYASCSTTFFPHLFGRSHHRKEQDVEAHLWVLAKPADPETDTAFPPTLAAHLVVKDAFKGPEIRKWARASSDANLQGPEERRARDRWLSADSVPERQQSIFRIARYWVSKAKARPGRDLWEDVRVVSADRDESGFFPHVDSTRGWRSWRRWPAPSP